MYRRPWSAGRANERQSASGKCEQAAEAPMASAMGKDKSRIILPGRSYTVNSQESPPRVPGCGDETMWGRNGGPAVSVAGGTEEDDMKR